MFILKCIIDQYCKTKDGRVFACFVDFQKAFDKVIHTGIKPQSVQNAESLSNFSCIPSADLDNKTMSSAYIKQWIGELSKMTGSFVLLR
jgi:hypothetical protein